MGPARLLLAKVYADVVSVQLVHAICAAADKFVVNTCSLQAQWPGH